jgi:hypothetical protein
MIRDGLIETNQWRSKFESRNLAPSGIGHRFKEEHFDAIGAVRCLDPLTACSPTLNSDSKASGANNRDEEICEHERAPKQFHFRAESTKLHFGRCL